MTTPDILYRTVRLPRAAVVEVAALALATVLVVAVYAWTDAPLYNPPFTIDPWLYTALWTNFDQTYHAFVTTYYASRVPWILPGYVCNLVFSPRTASLIVHTSFFFAGAIAVYFACRRLAGRLPALAAYVALIASQMYFNAQRWDYEEGAVLTYLALAVFFVTTTNVSPRWRAGSFLACGFFSAALVTTQLLDIVLLLGLPFLYWAASTRIVGARVSADIGWFGCGAFALVVFCGAFATINGGRFLFFMPQVDVARTQSGEANQQPPHTWIPREPYFFVPIFVVVLCILVLLLARPHVRDASRRLLIAAAGWTGLVYVVLCL
jgi:hypothetical protein